MSLSGGGVDQKRPIGSIKSAVIEASDIAQEHIDTEDDKSAAKALKPAAKKVDSSGSDNTTSNIYSKTNVNNEKYVQKIARVINV